MGRRTLVCGDAVCGLLVHSRERLGNFLKQTLYIVPSFGGCLDEHDVVVFLGALLALFRRHLTV